MPSYLMVYVMLCLHVRTLVLLMAPAGPYVLVSSDRSMQILAGGVRWRSLCI